MLRSHDVCNGYTTPIACSSRFAIFFDFAMETVHKLYLAYLLMQARAGVTGTRKVGRVRTGGNGYRLPEIRPKLRMPAGFVKHSMK